MSTTLIGRLTADPELKFTNKDFFEQKRKEREESVPMPKDFKRVLKLAP